MKLVTEYLADAANFEQLAAKESDPASKEQLLKQAAAYHRLAEKRAKALGFCSHPSLHRPLNVPSLMRRYASRTCARSAALRRCIPSRACKWLHRG